MSDTSRRDVLTGAAGLAAGSTLALPAPALAQAEPFRIEPSANFLELRRLVVLINENHTRRYWTPSVGEAEVEQLDKQSHLYWDQIHKLLEEMSSQPPRTPSASLDLAAVTLWHATSYGWGFTTDPCAALAQASEHASQQTHSELQIAWAIFALAAIENSR